MKKSAVSKIFLASIAIVILNACSKSNDIPPSGGENSQASADSSSTGNHHSTNSFELAYVISPLTSNIISITFNDENGNPKTVYDKDLFPGGIMELKVSSDAFKAKISVIVYNPTSHPVGFHLEIRVNGQTQQFRDFTFSTMTYINASAEYEVQLK